MSINASPFGTHSSLCLLYKEYKNDLSQKGCGIFISAWASGVVRSSVMGGARAWKCGTNSSVQTLTLFCIYRSGIEIIK